MLMMNILNVQAHQKPLKIIKIKKTVQEAPWLSIRLIAEMVSTDTDSLANLA